MLMQSKAMNNHESVSSFRNDVIKLLGPTSGVHAGENVVFIFKVNTTRGAYLHFPNTLFITSSSIAMTHSLQPQMPTPESQISPHIETLNNFPYYHTPSNIDPPKMTGPSPQSPISNNFNNENYFPNLHNIDHL